MQCLGFILKYCGLISIPELDFALVAWEGRNGKLGIGESEYIVMVFYLLKLAVRMT